MDRGTKILNTKNGHQIEVYEYMNAGEARQVQQVYLEGMGMRVVDGKPAMDEMSAELMTKAQDKTLEILVAKVDGSEEKKLERLLELPKVDFDEVVAFIDGLNDLSTEEKKTE